MLAGSIGMKWISLCAFLFSYSAWGAFAPPNNLKVYESTNPEVLTVTKANFESAINLVTKAYANKIASTGRVLSINNLWKNPTVNAQAYQKRMNGTTYLMVDAFGGLARYGFMTTDAFVGVLCHELGHHLGGAPRIDWASNEGQSDYWGFRSCMRKIMSVERAIVAAEDLAEVLARLGGERVPSLYTPDLTIVQRTIDYHPNAQCRLDTMFAGLKFKPRPRCWFKPS